MKRRSIRKKRKAQATVFLLLGIVLILIAVALVMLGRFATKKTTKQETIDASEVFFDVQPISTFVSECTTIHTKEALSLIGSQGGYIYGSQGGTFLDYARYDLGNFYVPYKDHKVSYNILRPRFSTSRTVAAVPDYPWESFPQESKSDATTVYRRPNAFGMQSIPPLNKSFGSHSLQDQVTRYISQNIDGCLDVSVFEDLGFFVDKKNKTVTVHLHENTIIVQLQYEMEIESAATGAKTTLREFQTSIPARIGEFHAFLTTIVENDISDAQYDITQDSGQDNFIVEVVKDVHSNDDIIIITDPLTKIDDEAFEYVFARKNRNPALSYISPEGIVLPARQPGGGLTKISAQTIIDYYPVPFTALDPDEDEIENITVENVPPIVIDNSKIKVVATDGEFQDYQELIIRAKAE